MFALPGILGLIFFLYIRPQEFIYSLQVIPFLYICLAMAVFGLAIDLRLRISRPTFNPVLPLVLIFFLWCAITIFVKSPDRAITALTGFAVPIVTYVVISQGIQTFKAIQAITWLLLVITLFFCVVGIHQGFAPYGCVLRDPDRVGDLALMRPDGRSCDPLIPDSCGELGSEPGAQYLCERVGWFDTNSVAGGRVRWRGILQDPNELALCIASTLPFMFCFLARRRKIGRFWLLCLTLALSIFCIVLTKSRGGIIVFLAAVGVYGFRRYGARGLVLGGILGAPLLLLGGRGGAEASQSSEQRLEAWATGIGIFRTDPIFGAGFTLFTDHHYLTAHNSYVLAFSELGFLGLFLWVSICYYSGKILYLGYRRYAGNPEAKVAADWGIALMAMLGSTMIGIFFLSFVYHPMLWIYLGLSIAFWQAVKRHDPKFEVRMTVIDWIGVFLGSIVIIVLLYMYLRVKGPGG